MGTTILAVLAWIALLAVLLLWFAGARGRKRLALPGPGEALSLGGRRFVLCESTTVAQDSALAELLARAGLDPFKPVLGGDTEEAATLAFTAIHKAGVMLDLLGCILLPEELARASRRSWLVRVLERWGLLERRPSGWTPAVAAETSRFLGQLDEPGEKVQVYALFAQAIVPFFVAGIGSSPPSPASSPAATAPTRGPSWGATSAPGEA